MTSPERTLTSRARKVLRAALVITWLLGVFGAATSCRALQHYGSPTPNTSSLSPVAREVLTVIDRHRPVRLPLAIANMLLSAALVVGAARTLGRRSGGKNWLRQVCAASAIFAVGDWFASRPYRDDLAEVASKLAANDPSARIKTHGLYAMLALLQAGLFGGLFVALGRSSVAFEVAPDPERRSFPPSSRRDDGEP
jgi:hypothetical protein